MKMMQRESFPFLLAQGGWRLASAVGLGIVFLALARAAGLAAGSAAPAAPATPAVHVLVSLAKAPPEPPSEAFLAVHETAAVIRAAKGECEALQLLVVAPQGGMRDLRLRCGVFTQASGQALPAGAVTAQFIGTVTTKEPYYGTLRVGEWPDPLLPDDMVTLPPGRAQSIWLEAAVPADAAPGLYRGAVELEAAGWSARTDLEIQVWDFALGQPPALASSFLLYPRYVFQYHHLEKESPEASAMLRRYHALMLAHRISPAYVAVDDARTRPRLRISDAGELRGADFTEFDRQVEWAMAQGQTVFGLEGPRQENGYSEAWYRSVGAHLAARGWLDRFYTYLFDETYEGVPGMTALVHRASPGLKNLITRLPAEGYPDVDWWCPRLGDAIMRSAEVDSWLARHDLKRSDLWVYTAGNAGSDVPALHLDVPGIEARITPMAVWKEGFGGLLFWCVNYWTVDPWTDPMVFPRQNGNGCLIYPGRDGPVASIRLKMLRDGFEDVDYAVRLAGLHDPEAHRLLAELPLAGALDWERDPRVLLIWREKAGVLLDRLHAAPPSSRAPKEPLLRERAAYGPGGPPTGSNPLLELGEPGDGWHGARNRETQPGPDGTPVLRFTLDAGEHKLWRLPHPRDWNEYDELVLGIALLEGAPIRLNLKLTSGLLQRKGWTWELHMAPGARRMVRIPLPRERLDMEALSELSLFLWEPDAPRRFELSGLWLR